MAPTLIFLARHGQTVWNRDGDRYCGSTDIELSPVGYQQAELLAQAVRCLPLAAIYASPLSRAQVTATPAARAHGLKVQVELGLRETAFGEFEGCTPGELERDRPAEYRAWRTSPELVAPPGGETIVAAAARAMGALDRIARRHLGQTVLVVAHNTLNRLVLCQLLGAPLGHYRKLVQNNACLNCIEWGMEPRVLYVNESAHVRGHSA